MSSSRRLHRSALHAFHFYSCTPNCDHPASAAFGRHLSNRQLESNTNKLPHSDTNSTARETGIVVLTLISICKILAHCFRFSIFFSFSCKRMDSLSLRICSNSLAFSCCFCSEMRMSLSICALAYSLVENLN